MWFFQDFYVSHPSSITLTQWKSLKSEWLSAFFPYLEWGIGLTYPSLALHDFPVAHWCSIWTSNQKVKSSTPVRWEYLHGVPKDRSSNFMHYNFWSRLYFYVKFLEDVYFPIEYMYSESQLLACPFFVFFITFYSRCGIQWDTACRPTDDPSWAFLSPGAQEPVQPPNNICLVQAAEKKTYFGHLSKKV